MTDIDTTLAALEQVDPKAAAAQRRVNERALLRAQTYRKIRRNYRFTGAEVAKLAAQAEAAGMNETEYLVSLIEQAQEQAR